MRRHYHGAPRLAFRAHGRTAGVSTGMPAARDIRYVSGRELDAGGFASLPNPRDTLLEGQGG